MNALRVSTKRSYLQASSFKAALSTSARRLAGKEDRLHTEGRAEEIEEHKRDQLNKKEEGQHVWKDELASNSESIIKAERGETGVSNGTIKKLQDEFAKTAKQKA